MANEKNALFYYSYVIKFDIHFIRTIARKNQQVEQRRQEALGYF